MTMAAVCRQAPDGMESEQAIGLCVRRFYEKAQTDPLLAPVFKAAIADWEHHLERIQDFWSRALLVQPAGSRDSDWCYYLSK